MAGVPQLQEHFCGVATALFAEGLQRRHPVSALARAAARAPLQVLAALAPRRCAPGLLRLTALWLGSLLLPR